MTILELIKFIESDLDKNCKTNEDSFKRFLDLITQGKMDIHIGDHNLLQNFVSLRNFIENDEDNIVALLTYISLMVAFHPIYAEQLVNAPSVKMAWAVRRELKND